MAIWSKWTVHCVTEDTDVVTWQDGEPTECPNNPAHEIGTVTFGGDALEKITLHSPTKVWDITVDDSGSISAAQVWP